MTQSNEIRLRMNRINLERPDDRSLSMKTPNDKLERSAEQVEVFHSHFFSFFKLARKALHLEIKSLQNLSRDIRDIVNHAFASSSLISLATDLT